MSTAGLEHRPLVVVPTGWLRSDWYLRSGVGSMADKVKVSVGPGVKTDKADEVEHKKGDN